METYSLIAVVLAHMALGVMCWWFLRGGGIESALLNYRNVPHLKPVAAFIFGIDFAYFCTDLRYIAEWPWPNMFQAVIVGAFMWLGSAPKWGRYIAAMAGNSLEGKSKVWGLGAMTLRGLFLGGCVALSWLVGAPSWFSVASLVCGAAMGPVYYLAFTRIMAQGKVFNAWTVAEMVFGALFYLPLAALAVLAGRKKDKPAN